MRPWRESDAEALYKYAKDPAIGPVAGWPPHTSVAESLKIIRTVFAAPETYAVVLKATDEPVGSVGIMFGDGLHSAEMQVGEAEIGYWIGVPYWGQGLIPEAVRCLLKRCFEDLGMTAVWCGYYDGNVKSRRVMEKWQYEILPGDGEMRFPFPSYGRRQDLPAWRCPHGAFHADDEGGMGKIIKEYERPKISSRLALFYSRSHSQWRAAGICIGEDHRRGMGIACQRNHIKRVYFPDNLDAIASNDKSLYLQR